LVTFTSFSKTPFAIANVKKMSKMVRGLKKDGVSISHFTEIRWGSLFDMLKVFQDKKTKVQEYVENCDPDFNWEWLRFTIELMS
jgi:hypothetical protein